MSIFLKSGCTVFFNLVQIGPDFNINPKSCIKTICFKLGAFRSIESKFTYMTHVSVPSLYHILEGMSPKLCIDSKIDLFIQRLTYQFSTHSLDKYKNKIIEKVNTEIIIICYMIIFFFFNLFHYLSQLKSICLPYFHCHTSVFVLCIKWLGSQKIFLL